MRTTIRRPLFRTVRPFGLAALLGVTLAGCMTPAEEVAANAQQDQGVCAAMGASYGSPAHTTCMLQQQQRRDQERLIFLEEARISSEMARNAQEMRENRSN